MMFCTCRSNIRAFYNSIDVAALPRAFQGAITVTRAFGTPSLWIDSLCISKTIQVTGNQRLR